MTVDEWRTYRRPYDAELAHLDWQPTDIFSWPELDSDLASFSTAPSVTEQDVYASLGPQAADMLRELDVDVDELIKLINAETTMLPVIEELPPAAEVAPAPALEVEPALALATQKWKKRFLKGAVVAVLASMVGGGVAMAMNKSVTLNVDGKAQTVNTYGSTVGDVLEAAEIKLGAHDAVSPAPSAQIGDDGVIKLERGRQLNLVVDGKAQQTWVRATTVLEALEQVGKSQLLAQGARLSAPADGQVPIEGMTLELKTLKHVTIHDGGEKPRQIVTNAVTVDELLKSRGITVGPKDKVSGGLSRSLKDGSSLHITRTGTFVIKVKEPIEPPVKEIEDDSLEVGQTKVIEAGKAGLALVTYRVTKVNNEETARKELTSKTLRKPERRVVRVGTKQPVIDDAAVWDRLAECESGGDWSINTGNGYYGGLQFNKGTWDAYGGDQYAAYPHEASREQQIAIATKLRDANGGYGAWPHCSQKLGLPQ